MTVPVGLVTFFFLPDTPHKTRAWFLTQDDKDLALRRVEEAGKAPPANLTWRKAGKILRGWSKSSPGSCVASGLLLSSWLIIMIEWWLFVLGYVVSCTLKRLFA